MLNYLLCMQIFFTELVGAKIRLNTSKNTGILIQTQQAGYRYLVSAINY